MSVYRRNALVLRKESSLPTTPYRLEKNLKKQIGATVSAESFDNRDPLYHISETFAHTFDIAGRRLGAQLAGEFASPAARKTPGEKPVSGLGEPTRSFLSRTSMDEFYQPTQPDARFFNKFSEVAFSRGTLAAAVLRGSGQMMLTTCLKRTIGQFQPRNERQRKLFQGGSVHKNVAGHPAQAVFNRATTDSAVGLVVDVVRDARRVVEALTGLAQGENVLPENSGKSTLLATYPFLTDAADRQLLAEYQAKLAMLPQGDAQRGAYQRAIGKTQALIARKRYLKYLFTTQLRSLSDNAMGALRLFSGEDFLEAVHREVAGDGAIDGIDAGTRDDSRDADAPEVKDDSAQPPQSDQLREPDREDE